MKTWLGRILPPLSVQVAVLLGWHFLAVSGWFPPTVLIPPLTVLQTLRDLSDTGELWIHLGWSLRRVGVGFAVGGGIGFAIGGLLGVSKRFESWVGPTLDALKQVPIFAWAPLMILVFGIEESSKVAFIAVACFYPVLLATRQGVAGVQKRYLEVAEVFGLSRAQAFRRVALPSALPPIITGVRQSLGLAWLAVVGAELLGAESGIGYLMTWSRQLFQMDGVLGGVMLVGVVGIAINSALEFLERRFVHWGGEV